MLAFSGRVQLAQTTSVLYIKQNNVTNIKIKKWNWI